MDERKKKEAEFHNMVRDEKLEKNRQRYKYLTSNRKFYSIARKSQQFFDSYLIKDCSGKKILDYCCGNGDMAIFFAQHGAEVIGVDISSISIKNAREKAVKNELKNVHFFVMDAENLRFNDNYFDLIICSGILHHLDIRKAYREMTRVLKSEGKIICNEPLSHNPIFQLYRRLTPYLRTKWEIEHILSREDIKLAENYFGKVEVHFFHLATFLALPFYSLPVFNFLLSILEKIDSIILRLPLLKWWAWQIVFILSEPKKY